MTAAGSFNNSDNVTVQVVKIYEDAKLPEYMTELAAGFDLSAYLFEREVERDVPIVIEPGQRVLVGTGLRFGLPAGYEIQVRPRSGLAHKHGVTVLNSPGTIDADYTGELKVLLVNNGRKIYTFKHGDRIAQGVLSKVPQAVFVEVDELGATERGSGGFGHTGRA